MSGETRILHLRDVQRYTSDPKRNVKVLVEIDWHRLAMELGAKAAYSKGKKSQAMRGAVVVKYLEDWTSV
jgi:hypothetical protein